MKSKIKYSCMEHVDIAIDDFLVEFEKFPNLEECTDKKCDYCTLNSNYRLFNENI